MLGLGSKKVVVSQVFAERKGAQEGKKRQEEVLVRVSGKFLVKASGGARLGQRAKKGSRPGKKFTRDQLDRLVKVLRQVSIVKCLRKYFDKERPLIVLRQDETWRRAGEESQTRGGVLGRSSRGCL